MCDVRVVRVGEAIRNCVRVCLLSGSPLATLAKFMQTLRESGNYAPDEALTVERTVVRVLRKALPSGVDGIWPDDVTRQPPPTDPLGRLPTNPAEA